MSEVTPTQALQKVREALEAYAVNEHMLGDFLNCPAQEAISLIPLIEQAMLPELPDGWRLVWLEYYYSAHGYHVRIEHGEACFNGIGNTPRQAVLNAIKMINNKGE